MSAELPALGATAGTTGASLEQLLERDEELLRLGEMARSPERLLIVEGPAGIGKTALLGAGMSLAAAAGTRVLGARASELETSFAYGVVRQLFEPLLDRAPPRERRRLLAGPAGAVERLMAEEQGDAAAEDDPSFAILRGLHSLTVNLAAAGPLAVFVDDAHWADRSSLRFLTFLARRIADVPIGIVLAMRPAERGAPMALLDELRLDPRAELLGVRALSEDGVARMVRSMRLAGADAEFAGACHRASAGNPFYLRELLRTLLAEGVAPTRESVARVADAWPPSVARHVLRRLDRTGPSAPALARAMAVLGDGESLRHAARLAGIDEEHAAAIARGMAEGDILASEDPFRFVHPVVRLAIYSDLTAVERDERHAAAAEFLIQAGGALDRTAAHLLAVRPARRARSVAALRDAARLALARGAPDVAVSYLRRALEEPPGNDALVGVLRELGRAEEYAGEEAAVDHLREALDQVADPHERAEVMLQLAATLESFSRGVEAVAPLAAEAARQNDPELVQRLEVALLTAGAAEPAPEWLDVYTRLVSAPLPYPAGQTVLAVAAGAAAWIGAPAEQTVALAEKALAMGPLSHESWDAIGGLFWALIFCEAYDTAREHLERELESVEATGHARGLWLMHNSLGLLEHRLGRLADAEAHARTALEFERHGGTSRSLAWPVLVLVEVLLDRGDLAGAESVLELMPPEKWPPHVAYASLLAARGRLRCAQGRWQEGLHDLLECGRRFTARVDELAGPATTHWRSSAAIALARQGDPARARRVAAEEVEAARTLGTPRALGVALRARGLVADGDQRLASLTESVQTLERSPALLERARSLAELGAALRRHNQRAAAREPLRRALDIVVRCGATSLAERVREELLAAGARPRRDRLTGSDALTASERRVAERAAQGMANREIAEALYLSVRTVEMHLSRSYRKLGIAGRGELADALRSPGRLPAD